MLGTPASPRDLFYFLESSLQWVFLLDVAHCSPLNSLLRLVLVTNAVKELSLGDKFHPAITSLTCFGGYAFQIGTHEDV